MERTSTLDRGAAFAAHTACRWPFRASGARQSKPRVADAVGIQRHRIDALPKLQVFGHQRVVGGQTLRAAALDTWWSGSSRTGRESEDDIRLVRARELSPSLCSMAYSTAAIRALLLDTGDRPI